MLLGRNLRRLWTSKGVAAACAIALTSCGGSDYGDPGPSWGGFEFRSRGSHIGTQIVVVVVDDRATADASALRAGLGDAVRQWAGNILTGSYQLVPDLAPWHPVDLRFVLVPASSISTGDVVSPAKSPALAWTSHQATESGRDAIALAVESEVQHMSASANATFRPLERARDIADLLNAKRSPSNDAERALVASTASQGMRMVGVAIVASTDDQSPNDPASYRLDDDLHAPGNVITLENAGKDAPDVNRFPRLRTWATDAGDYWHNGCYFDVAAPYQLFGSSCFHLNPRCDARPIREISPGLGDCYVEITISGTSDCDPRRGWADPVGTGGVRLAQQNEDGERICELLPVEARFMDACIHDDACADCGSGWCVSEVQPGNKYCARAQPARGLRWIGGALPEPVSLHGICREPD